MPKKYQILVCKGPECGERRHAIDVYRALSDELRRCPLDGTEVLLERYSCFGKCQRGVNVLIREIRPEEGARLLFMAPSALRGATLYHRVEPKDARRIVEEHIARGEPLHELTRRT